MSLTAARADLDLDHLRAWVGRSSSAQQVIDLFPARALAGLLDWDVAPAEGQALPLPWHWLYFLDTPSRAATGADGHPLRGGFLPPVPLPRRMWAAGKIQVSAPLLIGRSATKTSTVRSVELKHGHTGPLVFVTVDHVLQQGEHVCVREEQTLVYCEAPRGPAPLPPGELASRVPAWSRLLTPDAALLFRFSALTYNGHRIHYDREYATGVEFYPALVVHGPLLATLLLDLLRSQQPVATVSNFSFRALRPAFDTDFVQLLGDPTSTGATLWTAGPDGFVGMKAIAQFTTAPSH